MVAERAPSLIPSSDLHTFIVMEIFSGYQSFHAVEDGNGIVQSAERINHHVKAEVIQLFSDAVGEAASKHHYLVFV